MHNPDIPHLIAAINPDVFCEAKTRKTVKALLHATLAKGDRLAYFKAAAKATACEPNRTSLERLKEFNPFELPGQRSPIEQHTLVLDHTDEALEPLYFDLLDELQGREGWHVTKLVDTFASTSGAGLGADLTRRMLQRHEQAAKLLVRIHGQIRVLLDSWQKWTEQKRRLRVYDEARESRSAEKEAALRTLQNRWQKGGDPDAPVSDPTTTDPVFSG